MILAKQRPEAKQAAPKGAAEEQPPLSPEELGKLRRLFKRDLHQQVIAGIDLAAIGSLQQDQLREESRRIAESLCEREQHAQMFHDRDELVEEVLDEIFGLGPLEKLVRDKRVSDILINGPQSVYAEISGRLELTDVEFADNEHVVSVVQRIVSRIGRRIDETTPMVDARLPDGSRLNAIIPPLALDGPLVSIRRFGEGRLGFDDLLRYQSTTPEINQFLAACVQASLNTLVSGGTGSGKTTLLNILSGFIPASERVATIEDAAELQLRQPHVVRMETRPANVEGEGEVSTRDLVRNSLRMRPDRIVIGECRGPEALDMLQAMNTGHDGSLTTIHANTPRDAIVRLEMMVGMAGFELPVWTIRRQIQSAISIVVQVARLAGGVRRITKVSELVGIESENIRMNDIFEFRQKGVDEDRRARGEYVATGRRPECLERLRYSGVDVPEEIFEERTLLCC